MARLLWNPDVDIRAELADFLSGYYEEAGPHIAAYIDLMHDELEKSGLPLTIYGKPYDHYEKGYMRPELFARYEVLFDEAEKAVVSKPDVLERVRVARLPLTFSLFEIAKARGTAEDRVFEQADGRWRVRPEITTLLDDFHALCNKVKIRHFVEGGVSPTSIAGRPARRWKRRPGNKVETNVPGNRSLLWNSKGNVYLCPVSRKVPETASR